MKPDKREKAIRRNERRFALLWRRGRGRHDWWWRVATCPEGCLPLRVPILIEPGIPIGLVRPRGIERALERNVL
jgi:hypothetical protein